MSMIEVVPGKEISPDEAIAFINLVADMRDLQKDYFATRDKGVLGKAKQLEKEVDHKLARIRGNGQQAN
jgi:hypothetical protein